MRLSSLASRLRPPSVTLPGRLRPQALAVVVAALGLAPVASVAQEAGEPLEVAPRGVAEAPVVILRGVPFSVELSGGQSPGTLPWEVRDAGGRVMASGSVDGYASAVAEDLLVESGDALPLTVTVGGTETTVDPTLTPGLYSIIPPLVAVLLALLFREVITALLAGVWIGALAVAGFNPLAATWRVIDSYVTPAIVDSDHATIIVFSLLLGGLVGIVSRNGGTSGIVEAVAPFARTPVRGKIATWLAGMAIFFDDYANTLIVGNTMRPITDRLKISREKLAYLVDSTAAPVAAIVPVSTWVGYEITLIGDGFQIAAQQTAGNGASAMLAGVNPFAVFLQTIPYLFYPLLALTFVFLTSALNRDLGPMAGAEARASSGRGLFREGAQLATDTHTVEMAAREDIPHRWWNAAVPILTVVAVVLGGLYTTGRTAAGSDASLMDVIRGADSFSTLLWGSFAGCLMAAFMSVAQRLLSMKEVIDGWLSGMRAMMIAMVILVLAWSLGAITESLGTAQYLAQLLEGNVALQFMPVLIFLTAAAMAFATGTSWGTMAILIPLVIPLTVSLGGAANFDGGMHYSVLLGSISSVLAGAIFGDHCSPISDTTILSSTASGCDHVDHVKTQLPYALLVAVPAMLLGDIGTAFGLPNWIALLGGVAFLTGTLLIFGRKARAESTPAG